jgi:hypothetical protein
LDRIAEATHQADLDFCHQQNGADRKEADPPAFKQCMLGRGYRLLSTRHIRTPPSKPPSDLRWIDPDTGLSCENTGGAALCDPPKGTVSYFDPEQGLNCRRTGLVSVCSNL